MTNHIRCADDDNQFLSKNQEVKQKTGCYSRLQMQEVSFSVKYFKQSTLCEFSCGWSCPIYFWLRWESINNQSVYPKRPYQSTSTCCHGQGSHLLGFANYLCNHFLQFLGVLTTSTISCDHQQVSHANDFILSILRYHQCRSLSTADCRVAETTIGSLQYSKWLRADEWLLYQLKKAENPWFSLLVHLQCSPEITDQKH